MTEAVSSSYTIAVCACGANVSTILRTKIAALTAAGFRIAVISEPPPAPDTPSELLPDFLADKPSGAFLGFIFFVLEAI